MEISSETIKTMKPNLNLGCGKILMKDAVNVDFVTPRNIPKDIEFVPKPIIEYLKGLAYHVQFKQVRMFNVLEHLLRKDVELLPWLLNGHMLIHGEIVGTIPDFPEICNQFLSGKITLRRAYFDTIADGEHKSLWTKEELERVFHTDGFKVTEYKVGMQGVNAFFRIEKVTQTTTPVDLIKTLERT
jgi:hypothetical protein